MISANKRGRGRKEKISSKTASRTQKFSQPYFRGTREGNPFRTRAGGEKKKERRAKKTQPRWGACKAHLVGGKGDGLRKNSAGKNDGGGTEEITGEKKSISKQETYRRTKWHGSVLFEGKVCGSN